MHEHYPDIFRGVEEIFLSFCFLSLSRRTFLMSGICGETITSPTAHGLKGPFRRVGDSFVRRIISGTLSTKHNGSDCRLKNSIRVEKSTVCVCVCVCRRRRFDFDVSRFFHFMIFYFIFCRYQMLQC